MNYITRREAAILMLGSVIALKTPKGRGVVAASLNGKVFKSPYCGCCAVWVKLLRHAGIDLRVKDFESLEMVKRIFQVPEQLRSCH